MSRAHLYSDFMGQLTESKIMTAQELRQLFQAAVKAARALADVAKGEKRELTEDEAAKVDALMAKADKHLADAKRAERIESAETALEAPVQRHVPDPDPGTPPAPLPEQRAKAARKLPEIRQPHRHLRDWRSWGETREAAQERSYAADQWIRGVVLARLQTPTTVRAQQWLRENAPSRDYNPELRVMQTGDELLGGSFVPDEMADQIIDLRQAYGVMRQLARRQTMAGDTLRIPNINSDMTMYWLGEAATITASDVGTNSVNLVAKKLGGIARVANELIEDSAFSIGDFLTDHFAKKLAQEEDRVAINGVGLGTDGGITGIKGKLDANTGFAGAVSGAAGVDTYEEVTATDLVKTLGVCPSDALPNASWVVSQQGFSIMMERLAHAGGGANITTFTEGLQRRFMGYPVIISQQMDTGAATDLSDQCMALFGDFEAACVLGERRGITMAISTDVYFTSEETAIRGTERIDFVYHSFGDATDAGRVVALQGVT